LAFPVHVGRGKVGVEENSRKRKTETVYKQNKEEKEGKPQEGKKRGKEPTRVYLETPLRVQGRGMIVQLQSKKGFLQKKKGAPGSGKKCP